MDSLRHIQSIPTSKWNLHKLRFSSLIGVKNTNQLSNIFIAISKCYLGKRNSSNYWFTNLPIIDLGSTLLSNILDLRYSKYSPPKIFDRKICVLQWFAKGLSTMPIKYQYKLIGPVCDNASNLNIATSSKKSIYFTGWYHYIHPEHDILNQSDLLEIANDFPLL